MSVGRVPLVGRSSRTRGCSAARSGTAKSQSLMSNHLLPNSHQHPACHSAFRTTWNVFSNGKTSCRERVRKSPMTDQREMAAPPLCLRLRLRTRSRPLRPPRQLHDPPKPRLLRRRRRPSCRLRIAWRQFYGLPTPIPRRWPPPARVLSQPMRTRSRPRRATTSTHGLGRTRSFRSEKASL